MSKETRYDIFNAATKAHQKMVEESREGIRPLHRPKMWNRTKIKNKKLRKRNNWYKSGGAESIIFVPCTPNEDLKKRYEEEIRKSKFNIKIVERSGNKIRNLLHRKDPFKKESCDRPNCFVCTSDGKGKQICNKENIVYKISCTEECKNHDLYKGETSYSAYTRGL